MKFICFCYYDEKKFDELSEADLADLHTNCKPHDERMHATGKVIAVGSLSSPNEWKVASPKDGKPVISDGRYVEGSKQAGAFVIVEAENMDEALTIASKHPAANYGEHLGFAVEVRACDMFQWGKVKGIY